MTNAIKEENVDVFETAIADCSEMVSRRSICNSDEADSEGRRREAREVKIMKMMMMMMKMMKMIKMMKMMKMMMKVMILNIREAIHTWSFLWARMAAMMSSTTVLR